MKIHHFEDPARFRDRVEPYLLQHEAHHNLFFGILHSLIHQPERYDVAPHLLTVEDEAGEGIGVALMTPPHKLLLSKVTDFEALSLIAQTLHEQGVHLPGVLGPTDEARAFAERWQQLTGTSYHLDISQRIYQLEAVEPVPMAPGYLRPATAADRDLLVRWAAAFTEDAFGSAEGYDAERTVDGYLRYRTAYIWEDGEPVSMAVAHGPTPNGIRVSFVYTPPEQRRKGYATACVATLSQRLLDQGRRYCFLFTDLANPTSNHIYQEIGYRPVCDVDALEFVERRAGSGERNGSGSGERHAPTCAKYAHTIHATCNMQRNNSTAHCRSTPPHRHIPTPSQLRRSTSLSMWLKMTEKCPSPG
ncbi:MAG: GNAT family N-acetyltransferase [Chloroflexota bacterium]|nr:GNAT family N-acetyltransferase [Chloroflexota bacterium]